MTLRNFPPADQCTAEDLDAIADFVVHDPSASWDLAGSRDHIEALCRRYQALAQDLSAAIEERDQFKRDERRNLEHIARAERFAGELHAELATRADAMSALERALAAATNERDEARRAIADREDEIARINNERQAEVNEAAAQRERADTAQALAEIHETIARSALAVVTRPGTVDLVAIVHAVDGRLSRTLVRERGCHERTRAELGRVLRRLEEIRQTHDANDRIRSAFASAVPAICGVMVEELDHQLTEELAAHPDAGPLHHARDMRDPEAAWHVAAARHHRDRHAARHANREVERHSFVIGKFKRGDRGGQLPEETCAICGTDPRNAIHQEDTTP